MGCVRQEEQVNCYIITIEMAVDTVKETQLIERSKWKCVGTYEGKQVLSVFFSFFSDFRCSRCFIAALTLYLWSLNRSLYFTFCYFFIWMAWKELAKSSLISALHCQLSEIPETRDTIQTGNPWNGNSCEIHHQVVKRRWVVIPKLLLVKGLWGKHWEQDVLQDTMGSRACGCPAASAALPELGQSCLLWGHPLWRKTFFWQHQRSEESEVSIQTGWSPRFPWRPDSDQFEGFPISS